MSTRPSPEEMALMVWDSLCAAAQVAVDLNHDRDAWLRQTAMRFKEHARDQRHACAEAVLGIGDTYPEGHHLRIVAEGFAQEAHRLVMNARIPADTPEEGSA